MSGPFERAVDHVDRPEIQQGMTAQHRVRPLLPAAMRGDYAATDPFLALMEDWFPRGVFGKHPHRGIETVTYVLEGRIDHYDNQVNQGTILPGDAQWMTAGRGLIHNETPAEGVTVHSLQLWINLPAADKMVAPRYQDLIAARMPVRREGGAEIRVFSGASGGVSAPTKTYTPVTIVEIRLAAEANVSQDLPADYNGFVVALEGAGVVGAKGDRVAAGDVAWLTREPDAASSQVNFKTGKEPLRALLFAGRPLREPVVAGGPFVMNTPAEIEQAYRDYREGRFGPL